MQIACNYLCVSTFINTIKLWLSCCRFLGFCFSFHICWLFVILVVILNSQCCHCCWYCCCCYCVCWRCVIFRTWLVLRDRGGGCLKKYGMSVNQIGRTLVWCLSNVGMSINHIGRTWVWSPSRFWMSINHIGWDWTLCPRRFGMSIN